ncbi:MAG: tol-pal system-associated acyl-CoA thioesterase [Pseudomonadota bacterium]
MTQKSAFTWPVRVYYEDTDVGGVVYYANYLRYLERARTEWLRSFGIEQDRLLESERLMFVVTRASIDYRSPARFNDELTVSVEVTGNMRTSLEFHQSVHREDADGDRRLICEGQVRVACVSADSLRPRRLPASVMEALA